MRLAAVMSALETANVTLTQAQSAAFADLTGQQAAQAALDKANAAIAELEKSKGDTAAHILNGVPLLRLTGLSPTEGRIQIQSEGYGCEFRRIVLEPLGK